jgi:hypothetical protein
MSHTKPPYKVDSFLGVPVVSLPNGDYYAPFTGSDPGDLQANSEFIVKACNSFEMLLEACKQSLHWFDSDLDLNLSEYESLVKNLKAAIRQSRRDDEMIDLSREAYEAQRRPRPGLKRNRNEPS